MTPGAAEVPFSPRVGFYEAGINGIEAIPELGTGQSKLRFPRK